MQNKIDELFKSELVVVNIGPKMFGDAVRKQGAEVIQVDWKPLAGGDKEMIAILEALGGI
ncbi:MAG: hypothetical protein K0S04_202 [Herbinix sp.]|jgi:FdrA protein|nr:hypothetical protein [Herbinix sp.]